MFGLPGFWSLAIPIGAVVSGAAAWFLFIDRSRGRRRCPRCWYDMAAIPTLTCPECGSAARDEPALHRARRSRAAAGVLLVLAAFALWTGARAVGARCENGWWSLLPTRILVGYVAPTTPEAVLSELGSRLGDGRMSLSDPAIDALARRCADVIASPNPDTRSLGWSLACVSDLSRVTDGADSAVRQLLADTDDARLARTLARLTPLRGNTKGRLPAWIDRVEAIVGDASLPLSAPAAARFLALTEPLPTGSLARIIATLDSPSPSPALDTLAVQLPTRSDYPELLGFLDRLAARSGWAVSKWGEGVREATHMMHPDVNARY